MKRHLIKRRTALCTLAGLPAVPLLFESAQRMSDLRGSSKVRT